MNIVEVEIDSLDLRYAKLRARRPTLEKRLMASLEEAGQQSPVIVVAGEEPGRWVLIEGRKRVRALRRLKADAVKAVVWELAPAEALIAAYQLQDGSGWNALEEGWLVWELVRGGGFSLAEVGRRLKRSKGWVSGRLGLIEGLPESVLEGVLSGKILAYVATRYLLPFARANASDCEKLAEKVIEHEFTSREVEALCQHYSAAGPKARSRMVEWRPHGVGPDI
jgi:ParB-like chromosome segregation protein Spo0J